MMQKNCDMTLGGIYCVQGNIHEVSGDMNTYVYDKNLDGVVDNAELVNGFTVERDVLENEYTNEQIENLIETKTEEVVSENITTVVKIKVEEEIEKQNLINAISANEVPLEVVKGSVNIPLGSAENAGVVKSSSGVDKVSISENGEMVVNSINFNKLVQSEGETLVFDGGTSSL